MTQSEVFTFLSPGISGKMYLFLMFAFNSFRICISMFLPSLYNHWDKIERLRWCLFSISPGDTGSAAHRSVRHTETDVVGKYRFADAELMWQVSIIEFHCQQCCGPWERIQWSVIPNSPAMSWRTLHKNLRAAPSGPLNSCLINRIENLYSWVFGTWN